MGARRGTEIIEGWPEESREAAQLVIDENGEPHEATESLLIWHEVGPWKRMVASRAFYAHNFPAPHHDSVESFIDYRAPTAKFTELAEFDGSVIAERTGAKMVEEARRYYAKEFLDFRRGKPTPYMEKLRFSTGDGTADPDERLLPTRTSSRPPRRARPRSGRSPAAAGAAGLVVA
jgi:hypothetical protein